MEAETITRYRAWLESLPASERDIPYTYLEGRYWTPNEVLRSMEQRTAAGLKFIAAEEKLLRRG